MQPRRYLAVHLPWLAAESALIRGIARPDAPFVLIEKQRGALRIVALSRGAAGIGLTQGMALADARAQVPDLVSVGADPAADTTMLAHLLPLARTYTPSVAVDLPQGLMLDIAGCTHLLAGGESELVDRLRAQLAKAGLSARIACADTPDAARALARFGGAKVAHLPVEALEIAADAHLALRRAGLRQIGDLAALPRLVLAARFGTAAARQLARLLGEEDAHVTPAPMAIPVQAELRFAEPIGHAQDVLDALAALLSDVARQMERRGMGGRAFALSLCRSDGHVARLMVECGAPTRDPALVLRLLRDRIEGLADPLDPGFGYDSIGLAVPVTEVLADEQALLTPDSMPQRPVDGADRLLDRLVVRYGAAAVQHFHGGNSHIPERAGFLAQGLPAMSPGQSASEPGEPPLRPLLLIDPPERVEVLAAVPDGPPRRFRWRGQMHHVVLQEGPERIAPEWWRRPGGHDSNQGRTRDYYRVEDDGGRRFWLFRHGLYGAAPAMPDWYIHGLFG